MKLFPALLLSAALCMAATAQADVERDKTPTSVGMRPESNQAYFAVAGGLPACYAGVIWIRLDDAAGMGKAAYATVLAAKAMEKKIGYLEYSKDPLDPYGVCYLVQLEMA